jgi:hypothetical protein
LCGRARIRSLEEVTSGSDTTRESNEHVDPSQLAISARQFFIIVVGVLVALWADQLRAARADAALEVEYLESIVIDLEADLAQFDSADAWSRRQEAGVATVLALYDGLQPTNSVADLVAAVESAGWQYVPSITRNTIDDLRSTGNLRLLRDPTLRRAIASYYTTVETVSVSNAAMRDGVTRDIRATIRDMAANTPGVRPGRFPRALGAVSAEPQRIVPVEPR